MAKLDKTKLPILFAEIVRGYSVERGHFGELFIRHFKTLDLSEVDVERERFLEHAKSRGLGTIDDSKALAIKKKLWSEEQNTEIARIKNFIDGLLATKKKLSLKKQINQINKEIEEANKKLLDLEAAKAEAIGYCAEHYANRKLTEYYIYNSFFRDRTFSARAFSKEQFEEFDEETLSGLIKLYNETMDKFSAVVLKQIAVSSTFMNCFCLCQDNPYSFYGKPIVELTTFQVELFGYGRYFKSILSECQDKITPEIADDPEALIEWYDSVKNAEQILEKAKNKEGGGVSIVGATKEDLKRLGIEGKTIDFAAEAQKHGGALSMQDILKIHGEA